jgi:hypothetical protein
MGELPSRRAYFQSSRWILSTAAVAQTPKWKGSTRRTASGAGATVAHLLPPSALIWVS